MAAALGRQMSEKAMSNARACLSVLSLVTVIVVSEPALDQQQKSNIVFILADNVGYVTLAPAVVVSCASVPTPRIDQLAREGLKLTQFLVEPACKPLRAALFRQGG